MRKNSFYLLILALLILLFPLPTFAFSWASALRDVLLLLPTVGIAIVFGFFILISGLAVWLTAAILNWVTSPGFISLSYTRPSNPIIEMGLSITQSFVNLALVIILVVIALSIALRLGEYGSKKIFAKLIVIALLVNFAPVLVGLIVDASNIVMHFFLDAIGEGAADIGAQVVNYSSGLWKTMWQAGGSIIDRTGLVMQGITQIVVNVSMAIAFFLFAALFLTRYVVIWVLTILSPLAFVAWILPGTKKLWTMWWNQLIQWSIVGIPIAFFLYLAMNSFTLLRTAFVGKLQMVGAEPATVGFLNDIFPYFVIIIFLFLGFTIGLQTGAMGAGAITGAITGWAKTARTRTGKWARKAAARRVAGPIAGTATKGIAALARKTEKVPFLKYATRGLEMATVPRLTEYAAKQRKIKKPEGWDQISIPEKTRYISGLGMTQDQLVLASEMKGEGTFQKSGPDFQKNMLKAADKFKTDPRYAKEVSDIFDALPDKITKEMKIDFDLALNPEAKTAEKIKDIITDYKIEDDIDKKTGQKIKSKEDKAAQVLHIQGFKTKDISGVTSGSVKSESFQLAMRKMSSSHLQTLIDSFDGETVNAVLNEGAGLNTIKKGSKEIPVMLRDNPGLVKWAYNNPGGKAMLDWEKEWGPEKDLPAPAPKREPAEKKPVSGAEEKKPKEERGRKGLTKGEERGRKS